PLHKRSVCHAMRVYSSLGQSKPLTSLGSPAMFKRAPQPFALLLLLFLLCVSSLAVKAQTSTFRPVEQPKTPTALQAALSNQINLCPEETKSLAITVSGGPPNLQVTYNLTQNPAGILGLSTAATGPFTDQLSLTFTLDFNGQGQ